MINNILYSWKMQLMTLLYTLQSMLGSDNFDFRFECGVIQSAESYTMLQKPKTL